MLPRKIGFKLACCVPLNSGDCIPDVIEVIGVTKRFAHNGRLLQEPGCKLWGDHCSENVRRHPSSFAMAFCSRTMSSSVVPLGTSIRRSTSLPFFVLPVKYRSENRMFPRAVAVRNSEHSVTVDS